MARTKPDNELLLAMRELVLIGHYQTQSILRRIRTTKRTIMSQISDYAARVDTAFNQIGDGLDTIVTGVTGVTKDVADLKDIIVKLQTSPGPISPEDQALLDAGEAKVNALVTKTASVATAITALDALTETPPPVVPVPPA